MHLHDRGRHSKTTTFVARAVLGILIAIRTHTEAQDSLVLQYPTAQSGRGAARPLPQPSRAPLVGAMSAQYSATLTSFHTASPDKDPYTIYVITVKRGAQQWQVFRRYREVLCRRARTPG